MESKNPKRVGGNFTDEFKAGAVRLVLDEQKQVAQVARDLDLTPHPLAGGTLCSHLGLPPASWSCMRMIRGESRGRAGGEPGAVLKIGPVLMVAIMLVQGACSHDHVTLDPRNLRFGERDYAVEHLDQSFNHGFVLTADDDSRQLLGEPSDARHLAPCPPPRLIVADIDADGNRDLVLYSCGVIQVFLNERARLSAVTPIAGKRKERHWVRPDPYAYPGLDRLAPVIHWIDPDLEGQ